MAVDFWCLSNNADFHFYITIDLTIFVMISMQGIQ